MVVLGLAIGVKFAHLRAVAEAFADNWDLLDRVPPPPEIPEVNVDDWIADLEALAEGRDECIDADDKLVQRLDEFDAYAAKTARRARCRRSHRAAPSCEKPSFKVGNVGQEADMALRHRTTSADRSAQLHEQRPDDAARDVQNAIIRHYAVAIAGSPTTTSPNAAPRARWSSTTCSCSRGSCCVIRSTARPRGGGSGSDISDC